MIKGYREILQSLPSGSEVGYLGNRAKLGGYPAKKIMDGYDRMRIVCSGIYLWAYYDDLTCEEIELSKRIADALSCQPF